MSLRSALGDLLNLGLVSRLCGIKSALFGSDRSVSSIRDKEFGLARACGLSFLQSFVSRIPCFIKLTVQRLMCRKLEAPVAYKCCLQIARELSNLEEKWFWLISDISLASWLVSTFSSCQSLLIWLWDVEWEV